MKYFIDTNIIIDFLNKKQAAIDKITELARNTEAELYTNRVVCLESLRTIHFEHTKKFVQAKETIDSFEKLDILPEIYETAIHFSRFCKHRGISLKGKCEAIDFLHFITAKHYNLEIISNDSDISKLKTEYLAFRALA